MQLDVNGQITKDVGPPGLVGAFAARPTEGDWSITLEDPDGCYLQAFAGEGENYRLTSRCDDVQTDGRDELNAQAAKQVMAQYLSGNLAWRDAMDWKAQPALQPLQQGQASSPAAGIGYLLVGLLIALILYEGITKAPAAIPTYFPRATADPRLVALVGSMGLITLLLALASLVTAMRARSFPTAQAEVMSSKIEEDTVRIGAGGDNSYSRVFFPVVEYGYTVEGTNYTCKQIKLGLIRKSARSDASAVLARYPVGARVVAYYDPRNPKRAFLEYSVAAPVWGLTIAAGLLAFFAHLVGVY